MNLPLICSYLEYKGETGRPLTFGCAADLSHQALGIIHLVRQRPQGWWQSAENSNTWLCSEGHHRALGNGASPPVLPPHINITQSLFLPPVSNPASVSDPWAAGSSSEG